MDLSIKGKISVVTGGDSWIALATAKILAGEGINIVLTDMTHEELEKAAEEVRSNIKGENKIVAVSADLTKNEDAQMLAAETKKQFGGADILVNCARHPGGCRRFLEIKR